MALVVRHGACGARVAVRARAYLGRRGMPEDAVEREVLGAAVVPWLQLDVALVGEQEDVVEHIDVAALGQLALVHRSKATDYAHVAI